MVVGVVCVAVVVVVFLGASIVERGLSCCSERGVVCAVGVSALCVLCLCVLWIVDDGCVVEQGAICFVDFAVICIVDFTNHRIAVGFFISVHCV